eukprot:TRINITY_DN62521_c0_g1_i1.p1 TRINITY_DN62521_c0_g1~~TRINITY_DN62521_c0_g1_i1.p1  ORF type:complete len:571 (+),score=96.70 TRINITY_DN62521_c0_g1_i1:31-1713(+)
MSANQGYGTPSASSANALGSYFPRALQGPNVVDRAVAILAAKGFTRDNTLFAHSTCVDEVNNADPNSITPRLHAAFGGASFPLGGLAGVPWAGKTGFGAFSAHIPDGGNAFVLFAPHIGINSGSLGKLLRNGQSKGSTCCGAGVAAWNAIKSGATGGGEVDPYDYQQSTLVEQIRQRVGENDVLNAMLAAGGAKTEEDESRAMYAVGQIIYEISCDYMRNMYKQPPQGNIVFMGGMQINMSECTDYFDVWSFELLTKGSNKPIDLLPELLNDPSARSQSMLCPIGRPSPQTAQILRNYFPTALQCNKLADRALAILAARGFNGDNTLFAHSTCVDEVNNSDPNAITPRLHAAYGGASFPLGGLAGVPWAGKTGFGAFSAHIPDGGNAFVLFAPHIGINTSQLGKLLRVGQKNASTCCGAGVAAWNQIKGGGAGSGDVDPYDYQQSTLVSLICERCRQNEVLKKMLASGDAKSAEDESRALFAVGQIIYEISCDYMRNMYKQPPGGDIVFMGGIQINIAECTDYFDVWSFELLKNGSKKPIDLLPELLGDPSAKSRSMLRP